MATAASALWSAPAWAAPSITEFTSGLTSAAGPMDAAQGPNSDVWFTENSNPGIGKITTSGSITEYRTGLTGAPRAITKGPDGNLWFTEPNSSAIGRITPQGVITEFTSGLGGTVPTGITAGPDGNLWFTDDATPPKVGNITTQGVVTEFSNGLNSGNAPLDIAAGHDGNLWFTENASGGAIGRITSAGAITEFTGASGTPQDIAAGPDGNVWFTAGGSPGAIGRITRSGTITMFTTGLTAGQPVGIATGSDGRIYFAESGGNGAVGAITTGGRITEYTVGLTLLSSPWGIAPGADGNIWFTENASPGRLAQLTIPPDADTKVPTNVTDGAATLQGTVKPNSQATTYFFEYGPSTAYGSQTPTTSAGSGSSSEAESANVAGLAPSTTYHYRLVATNASGTNRGPDRSFTTQPTPAPTSAAAAAPASPSTVDSLKTLTPPSPALSAGDEANGVEPGGEQPGELIPPAGEPPPSLGHSVVVNNLFDHISVRLPGANGFVPLAQFRSMPVGSTIDARGGKVQLTSAAAHARRQSAVIWGGVFTVRQTGGRHPETELVLAGGNFKQCGSPASVAVKAVAARARSHRVVRALWARDDHGAFRTRGSSSVATVRGTKWLTEDRCDGTLTRVVQGAVSVRGRRSRHTVLVRAPRAFLARSGR